MEMKMMLIPAQNFPAGDADKNLDYQEVVHVLIRRQDSCS